MTSPCCTARTRRVVNDRPSRTRSTSKTIGTRGSPGPQEVRVQRVHGPVRLHGAPGRDQGLPGDLAAEDPRRAVRRADAAEQVQLEPLEVEQRDELVERGLAGHHPVGLTGGADLRCGPGRRHARHPRCTSAARQAWSSSPRRCTRIRFVEPDVPGGEPATMTTMSPALNRPIDRIALSTWRTIASVEVT